MHLVHISPLFAFTKFTSQRPLLNNNVNIGLLEHLIQASRIACGSCIVEGGRAGISLRVMQAGAKRETET